MNVHELWDLRAEESQSTQSHRSILKRSKDKYEQTVMPQTRSKAKTSKSVQVDDNDDNHSSASGSSIGCDQIEVSSFFFFLFFLLPIYSCLISCV